MMTLVHDSQGYADDEMTVFLHPNDEFYSYVGTYFGILPEDLYDGALAYGNGYHADEIVILRLKDSALIAKIEESMRNYIERRINHFTGYVPEMVFMLDSATFADRGNYLALMICPQPVEAKAAFYSAFDSDITSVPPIQETVKEEPEPEPVEEGVPIVINEDYDHEAVLTAWRTGDTNYLSEKNLTVLNITSEVIDNLITEDMSEYDKELAIHDWIVGWAAYDVTAIDRELEETNPDSSTPYGTLVNQQAICRGYTTTFQLFMDMLVIECIIVDGKANDDKEVHAWNMVRLEGEWYCVDVTWDDPISSVDLDDWYHHAFFNVPSQHLAETKHFWDEASYPVATAEKYRWHGLQE